MGTPRSFITEDHLEWSFKTGGMGKYCQHLGFYVPEQNGFKQQKEHVLFAYIE